MTTQNADQSENAYFEGYCAKVGLSFPAISKARNDADKKLHEIRQLFIDRGRKFGDTLSLVVFGSLARREFTSGSDVDWTLLVDGPVDPEHFQLANDVRQLLSDAGFTEPGNTGTFGTLVSSYDLVHYIGGLDDPNRNMTRRLLLLLESRAVTNELVRSRIIRAVLHRYIICGHGLRDPRTPGFRVPRFLLNDFVRYWRTVAVDYAAKKWEQSERKWAIRNAKLRGSRKMTFVKGILLCFDCELFPCNPPWNVCEQTGAVDDQLVNDQKLVIGCENLVEFTPIDLLSRLFDMLNLKDSANRVFGAYNDFLAFIDDASNRKHLEGLTFDSAGNDPIFIKVRHEIGKDFGEALEDLFFDGPPPLKQLTRRYGLF